MSDARQTGREALERTTRYDPAEVEARVFAEWIEGGYFHPEAEGAPRRASRSRSRRRT